MEENTRNEIKNLIERTKSILISAINSDGIPIIKGVTKLGNDDIYALYFCTSQESEFFKWYNENPKTSVYLFDDDPNTPYPSTDEKYYSLSLMGFVEVVKNLIRFVLQCGKYYKTEPSGSLSLDFKVNE